MRLGAFDYLQKPIDSPAEIRLLAARALERRHLLAFREKTLRKASGDVALSYGDPVMLPAVDALRKVAATDATEQALRELRGNRRLAAEHSASACSPSMRRSSVTVSSDAPGAGAFTTRCQTVPSAEAGRHRTWHGLSADDIRAFMRANEASLKTKS